MVNVKNRVNEITEQLEQGLKELFESKKYMEYLNTMSKFHDYSSNNILLIHMQKPDASLVHGYKAWKDDFGRQVMGGEHAIKILAPAPYKKIVRKAKLDKNGNKMLDENGAEIMEKAEIKIPAFKVVNVFDISQTTGRELPAISVDELTGDVEQYIDFFKAAELAAPVPVGFEKIQSGAKGYYSQTDKRIAINEGMSELQNFKTLIHETAHAKLHDIDLNAPPKKQADRPDRRTREVQAESIAYAVCQHYGLDTSDYSFSYVAQWSSGRELAELKASLETIRSTASELIKDIDKNFAELTKDKEQAQAQETPENEPMQKEKWLEQESVAGMTVEEYAANGYEPYSTSEKKKPVLLAPGRKFYYIIDEGAARRANNANSYYKYEPGSATVEYRKMVDKAVEIGEQQKKRVDPMYHEKIDSLVITYARKLAENMNNRFSIETRVPSILIAGDSNFPVHMKEKQKAARDRNMEEWNDIQGLLDKIRSTGMGGISADDPQAVQKLEAKLEKPDEKTRETLKGNGFRWSPKAGAWQKQVRQKMKEIGGKPSVLKNLTEKKKLLDDGSKQQNRVNSREEIR